jgi:hypothetical protein
MGERNCITKNMKSIILILLIFLIQPCLAKDIDFLSIIKGSAKTSKSLGIHKLTKEEQVTLNALLNRAYQLGAESHAKRNNQGADRQAPKAGAGVAAGLPVYITKIDDDKGDILKLANGAIVEITGGFLGFVGFRKDAVLYKEGRSWKIWIEGKKSYSCDVIKAPKRRPSGTGKVISISEVKGNGKILTTLAGSFFEVGDLHTIETSLWLGYFDALLIDGTQLLNLDEGGEIIDVTKIR